MNSALEVDPAAEEEDPWDYDCDEDELLQGLKEHEGAVAAPSIIE